MRTNFISNRQQPRGANLLAQSFTWPSRGFTLLELLVVAAILIVMTAIALPTFSNVIASAKLRGGMSDLSGLFQTCRSQAVKQNVAKHLIFTTSQGGTVGYVDVIPGSGLKASMSQVRLPSQFNKVAAPDGNGGTPPPLNASTMWGGASTTAPDTLDDMCFSSRGIPCTCTTSTCTGITNGYAFYFTNGSQPSRVQWAAVGVSPAGRIKTYFWYRSAWAN